MCSSDVEVVADNGYVVDDVVQERTSRLSAHAGGDLDPHSEFGDRDRSDRNLIIVGNQCVEVEDGWFGVDEDIGVEQEKRQNRSSSVTSSRRASISSRQARSIR